MGQILVIAFAVGKESVSKIVIFVDEDVNTVLCATYNAQKYGEGGVRIILSLNFLYRTIRQQILISLRKISQNIKHKSVKRTLYLGIIRIDFREIKLQNQILVVLLGGIFADV